MRAGKLRSRQETDNRRVLRWMETREYDMVLKDGPGWWLLATAWAGGSLVSETIVIGVLMDEVLLRVRETSDTQQPDKVVDTAVPETSIRIGTVMDKVLLRGGEPLTLGNLTRWLVPLPLPWRLSIPLKNHLLNGLLARCSPR